MWRCSTSFSCLPSILTICVILHAEWLKMLRQKHKGHIINAICDLRNPGCHSSAFKNLFRRPGLRPVFPEISPIKTVLMAVTRWKSKREAFLRPLFFSPTSKITLMPPVAKRQYVGPTVARPSWCNDTKRLTWIRCLIFRMFWKMRHQQWQAYRAIPARTSPCLPSFTKTWNETPKPP